MHAWIVRRIVGPPLRPGLAARRYRLLGLGRHFSPLRPVIPDLTANPGRQIIVDTAFHQRISALRKQQWVVSSGTGTYRLKPQNSMKSNRG